jgi:hypothetical protein
MNSTYLLLYPLGKRSLQRPHVAAMCCTASRIATTWAGERMARYTSESWTYQLRHVALRNDRVKATDTAGRLTEQSGIALYNVPAASENATS